MSMLRDTLLLSTLALGALLVAPPALAQDEEDDFDDVLDDIMKDDEEEDSAAEERRDLERGDLTDTVGVDEEELEIDQGPTRRRLIKTLQRKNFLKLGRYEIAPHLGFVTNDPFINRYLAGASVAYHVTEILAIEGLVSYSPDFGKADWKPITEQLVNENRVSPDISKITGIGNVNFQFSPIYGKISVMGRDIINFDVFGVFGAGAVTTHDDLDALQCADDITCTQTANQVHPTTNFGGGFRVIFSDSFAARLEGRSLIYIETVDSTHLEYKNNVMLQASASFFFPGVE